MLPSGADDVGPSYAAYATVDKTIVTAWITGCQLSV